jgi:glycosyltransferase involved in cell wall biosynthesis
MKISIVVQGRFHAFNMAYFFQQKNMLNEIITGYPAFYVRRFGIQRKYIKPVIINELINRVTYKLFKSQASFYWANEIFDWISSRLIKTDSDVYFIWSGSGLRTIRAIRKKNPKAKVILVRCSGHIEVQEKLLQKVSTKPGQVIDPRTIQKELKEYQEADYITLPSTFALNTFKEKDFDEHKLFLNRYGVDLKEFPFYKKNGVHNPVLTLGYVGALSKRKNITSIISVIEKLTKEGKNIKLILAGAIDYESFDPVLLKNYSFIDYRGKLPQSELHKLYSVMDVFVINSVEEGLAYVQMQAMSCGLPIISTTNAGGLDLVKDGINGFTIPILDENALEEKITWFYNNKDKIAEMGLVSRQVTESSFSWDDFGERNLAFLMGITGTK